MKLILNQPVLSQYNSRNVFGTFITRFLQEAIAKDVIRDYTT